VVGSQLSKMEGGGYRAKDCIKIEDNAELGLYLFKEKSGSHQPEANATIKIGKNRHGREGIVDAKWSNRFVAWFDPNKPAEPAEEYDAFADEDAAQEQLEL